MDWTFEAGQMELRIDSGLVGSMESVPIDCGGAGNDWIEAGTGNDYINGNEGNDLIEGNTGSDTVAYTLNASLQQADPDPDNPVASAGYSLTLNGIDETAQDITTTNAISGDMMPLLDADGNEIHDQWGNIIPIAPQPGRADTIYDTTGNDLINAGGGNDTVWKTRSGDDIIDLGAGDDDFWTTVDATGRVIARGGDGRDYLGAGSGRDLIEGGDGADGLYGSAEADQLYGGAKGNTQDLITQGATQQGTNQQGEWFDTEDGNDCAGAGVRCAVLFNEAANDSDYQPLLERSAA